jgi:GAF domain-containing protein
VKTPQAGDFAEIAMQLHGEPDVEATLSGVVSLAAQTLGADMCGVMLVHRGRRVETAAVTDELVTEADRLQCEFDEGPCLEAMEAQSTFIIEDTAREARWAQWCRAVHHLGIKSVLSVRLHTAAGTIGSINAYSLRVGAFDLDDAAAGTIFAGHASIALAAAQTESGLREAMDGRHVIGLAQGILMERFDLSADQAFAVLRRYSQDRNTKLRAVAAHVVSSRSLPD